MHKVFRHKLVSYSFKPRYLKLRLQYFGYLMRREDSLEKTLMLGKCEGKRRRGRQRMRWLDSVIEATNINLTQLQEVEGQEGLACCGPWGHEESDTTKRLNSNNISNTCLLYTSPSPRD